ncbi:hypothetical protein ES703_116183 [subsurface metagenome]
MPLTINNRDFTPRIELISVIINDTMNIIVTVNHHLVPYSRECFAGMVTAFAKDGRIVRRGRGYVYPGRYGPIACSEVKNGRIATVHIIIYTVELQRTAYYPGHPQWVTHERAIEPIA